MSNNKDSWVNNLSSYAIKGKYCQYGESGIIDNIFKNIGTTNKFCVEFGAGNGYHLSNTRKLFDDGWTGLLLEGNLDSFEGARSVEPEIRNEFVNAENVNSLFEKYGVPKSFDFLSIDIDGNDLWVWKALNFEPRVVVIEFNGTLSEGRSITIKYDPEFKMERNNYYGASFMALKKLGKEKGYSLVYQMKKTNMFFVKSELLERSEFGVSYTPVQYHPQHPRSEKYIWVEY